ncbi:MAG TPA: spore cortex-lytic enzyme, partial [Thermoclostridium caenicola]|nr:spore cortex-lytic enzyme [Thermoclostridium caenicola]
MEKRAIYAWVCFVFFITVVIGLAGSMRAQEIQEYHRAALSYYGSSGQEVIQIQRKLKNWGYY